MVLTIGHITIHFSMGSSGTQLCPCDGELHVIRGYPGSMAVPREPQKMPEDWTEVMRVSELDTVLMEAL